MKPEPRASKAVIIAVSLLIITGKVGGTGNGIFWIRRTVVSNSSQPADVTSQLRSTRRGLTDKLTALPIANSVDGRTFTFQGPISLFLNPGDYARITTPDGRVHIGQVLDREIREYDGPEVNIEDIDQQGLDSAGFRR